MTTLTEADAQRLAAFLHGLQPDWYETEIVTALWHATRRAGPPTASQIAVAAIRCAANPANGTPARIAEHGHHWTPWPDEPIPTPAPARIVTCEHCGGVVVDTNRGEHLNRRCVADHQAAVYARGSAAAKAALAAKWSKDQAFIDAAKAQVEKHGGGA